MVGTVQLRSVAPLQPVAMTEQLGELDEPPPAPVLAGSEVEVPDQLEEAVFKPLVDYPATEFSFEQVEWTVPRTLTWADLGSQWGLPAKTLRSLNPSLRKRRKVKVGERLVVFRLDADEPPRSVGAPNRGKLLRGLPFPEGDAWRLRERRARVYGSTVMVRSMLMAFEAYAHAFPDAPAIRLGDLSDRNGGRLSPHVSHRTGRDVDIGYILRPESRTDRYWQNAKEDSFDVEKNWYLVKALIETGRVQQIFMSARLQRLLIPLAERELSDEQMARYFRKANPDPRSSSIIKHWRGHLDHMHVRFSCEPENNRCRSRSR